MRCLESSLPSASRTADQSAFWGDIVTVPRKPRAPHCCIWQGSDMPLSSGVSLAERRVGNEALGQGGGQVSVLHAGPEGQPTPHLPRNPTAPTGRMLVGLLILQDSSLSPSLTRTPDFRAHSLILLASHAHPAGTQVPAVSRKEGMGGLRVWKRICFPLDALSLGCARGAGPSFRTVLRWAPASLRRSVKPSGSVSFV